MSTVLSGGVRDTDDVKNALATAVLDEFQRRDLTQSQAAALLGVKQSRVSEIATRRFRAVSIDRLLTYAEQLNLHTNIAVDRSDSL